MWNLDKDTKLSDEELYEFLQNYANDGYHVYVGTDSQAVQEKYVFATAVCLHHPTKKDGVCYFWTKERHLRKRYYNLQQRMLKEASMTLEVAQQIRENTSNIEIEVHFDIASDERYASHCSVNLITSYAKGYGFKYKIKPESWAASGAADGHCKR